MKYIEPLARLIAQLSKLPSVGEKTAARYAYAILNSPEEEVNELVDAIRDVKQNVHFCKICGNYTENEICDVCATRKPSVICVVKEPKDIVALEKVKDLEFAEPVIENGKLKVTATNNTTETKSAVLIVASYENGVVKSVSFSDETDILPNSATLETKAPETSDYKVMIWDSLNTMRPLN